MRYADVHPRILEQPLELVELTAERQQEHAPEVGVAGVAHQRPTQQLEALPPGEHAATGGVGERHDAVDGREVAQEATLLDLGGDEARDAGRAVHRGQEADHVAGPDLAVAPPEPLKGALGDRAWGSRAGLRQLVDSVDRAEAQVVDRGRDHPTRWLPWRAR